MCDVIDSVSNPCLLSWFNLLVRNARLTFMERLIDKACIAFLSLGVGLSLGEFHAGTVLALLAALSLSSAFELLSAPMAHKAILPILNAALACIPEASLWVLPLAAYDLVRVRMSLLPIVLVPLLLASQGALAAQTIPCLGVVLVSVLLAMRSSGYLERETELHSLRDTLQERLLALEDSHRQLEEARDVERHAATLAERTRISREIHDSVGHLLTRAILQIEAMEVVHAQEDGVRQDFHEIGETVREALDVTRASVHALADESRELSFELKELARDAAMDSIEVSVDADEEPPALVTSCLIAVCREALTNAARHARARHAWVRVVEYPGLWQMSVVNDGGPVPDGFSAEACFAKGNGLLAMRERVEALGGRFSITCETQFKVFVSIPKGGAHEGYRG